MKLPVPSSLRSIVCGGIIIGALLSLCAPWAVAKAEVVVDAKEFGLDAKSDAGLPLRRALEACRSRGAGTLVIPAGRYHMSPAYAADYYSAPSNGDRGMKRVGLLLDHLDGLKIEAAGVELLLQGQMVGVIIDHSRNVTVKGLTIDWEKILSFDATVVAVNAEQDSFDLEVHPDCVADVVNGTLLHGEDPEEAAHTWPYRQDLAWTRWFVPEDDNWLRDGPYSGEYSYQAWNSKKKVLARAEALGERRFRLFNATRTLPKVGWRMGNKGMRTPNRRSPAIWIAASVNTRLEDVRIYHAGGMGVIAEKSRDVQLVRVQVVPRPGSNRLVSTSADATHFSACAGLIEFADCEFARMMDDGTNVHGLFFPVDRIEGPRRVIVRAGHFQQVGHRFADAGDRIRFSTADMRELQTVTVAAVEVINEQRLLLVLAEDLSRGVAVGGLADNASWEPEVHMHGCTIRNNLARAALFDTPRKIVVENNRFYRDANRNIDGGPDARFWFEAGHLTDITFRGNRFEVFTRGAPAITFSAPHAGYHKGLVIEDNEFVTNGGAILTLKNFDDVVFRRNRIESHAGKSGQVGFDLNSCRNVEISQNTGSEAHPLLITQQNGCANVRVVENIGIVAPVAAR